MTNTRVMASCISAIVGYKVVMACDTKLDTLESPPHSSPGEVIYYAKSGSPEYDVQPATALEQTFRHSGWTVRRRLVWEAMIRTHQSDAKKSAFANCGARLRIEREAVSGELRMRCNHCHDRFCVPCGNAVAGCVAMNIKDRCQAALFITLTLRHSPTPLKDQIKRLYDSFNKLRRRKFFTAYGGAAFLEVKLSKAGQWHPHLHIIADGQYMDAFRLSQEWHAVTGDSCIVDIRRVKDGGDVASYVSKYVTKPADATVFAVPDRLDEMMIALKGVKMMFTFGTWRRLKLKEMPESAGCWELIASLGWGKSELAALPLQLQKEIASRWPSLVKFLANPSPPQ